MKVKNSFILFVTLILLISMTMITHASQVNTISGNGIPGYVDGELTEAQFNAPCGLGLDAEKHLIIVDSYNNRIRKIIDGKVITLAGFSEAVDAYGNPVGGLKDGNVTEAKFNRPRDIVVDSKGNLYISDTRNHVIRKIVDDKVYTFAGNGTAGYKDGQGNNAQFNLPIGIAIDIDDNIYVADSLNHCIRKITANGKVTTYAGKANETGGYADGLLKNALFNEPSDLAFDAQGNILILDSGNQLIRIINNKNVETFAGAMGDILGDTSYHEGDYADGLKENARFNFPKGIGLTEEGIIFIADTYNHRIRAIMSDGKVITIAGSGQPDLVDGGAGESMFNAPSDVLYSEGVLYISDMWNNAIRTIAIDPENVTGIGDRTKLLEDMLIEKSDTIQVWYNKEQIQFPDEMPYLDNGMIYLPLRFVLENWGAQVNWMAETQQVKVEKNNFNKIFNPSEDETFIVNNRTFINSDDLSYLINIQIEWLPEYNAVIMMDGE